MKGIINLLLRKAKEFETSRNYIFNMRKHQTKKENSSNSNVSLGQIVLKQNEKDTK